MPAAAGKPEVEAQIDAVMSRFVARANEVRNQLNSQAWGPGKALDEVRQGVGVRVCSVLRVCAHVSKGAGGGPREGNARDCAPSRHTVRRWELKAQDVAKLQVVEPLFVTNPVMHALLPLPSQNNRPWRP